MVLILDFYWNKKEQKKCCFFKQ